MFDAALSADTPRLVSLATAVPPIDLPQEEVTRRAAELFGVNSSAYEWLAPADLHQRRHRNHGTVRALRVVPAGTTASASATTSSSKAPTSSWPNCATAAIERGRPDRGRHRLHRRRLIHRHRHDPVARRPVDAADGLPFRRRADAGLRPRLRRRRSRPRPRCLPRQGQAAKPCAAARGRALRTDLPLQGPLEEQPRRDGPFRRRRRGGRHQLPGRLCRRPAPRAGRRAHLARQPGRDGLG